MSASEVIIKSTHRGLRYSDGVLTGVLDPGRHELPVKRAFRRTPEVEIVQVDMREVSSPSAARRS